VTVQRTVATSLALATGTTIELKGTKNQGEFARVDYIELERVGDMPPGPSPAPSPGPSPTPENGSGVILNLQTNVALSPIFGAADTPRLLPLGDSITAGVHGASSVPGGYRIQFWDRSVADGLAIDFVGSENSKSGSLTDGAHAGFPGRRIDQTTDWVNSGNLSRYPADAILLMIGTNDANSGISGANMRSRLSTLIDAISSKAPNTHLFVSSIPPFDTPKGTAKEAENADIYNALIPDLVAQKASQGKQVSYVNAGGSLSVGDINGDNSFTTDLDDGIHPSAKGYDKLGDAWYNLVFNPKPLTGSNLEGTQFADRLIGNGSSNILRGNGGQDQLTGGGGSDVFDYKKPTEGTDKITDFGSDDIFRISAAGFGGGLINNIGLDSSSFILGSNPVAIASKATFLYDTNSNTLSFDQDGTGNTAALGIATLTNGYMLQSNQIDIVA
ncbi:MAG: GDSL-type esterase/lipase family protein, partial [Phormidesmis sp.]